RLARAGRPRDEDQPAMFARKLFDTDRKLEAREGRNVHWDHATGERDVAALAEGIDSEPRQPGDLVSGVELARLVECSDGGRRRLADLVEDLFESLGR